MHPEILSLANILWEYHHMHQQIVKSDLILVLGSQDMRVADRGIQESAFLQCWTIREHIFSLKNRNRLSDSDIANIGGDKKLIFIISDVFNRPITSQSKKIFKNFAIQEYDYKNYLFVPIK